MRSAFALAALPLVFALAAHGQNAPNQDTALPGAAAAKRLVIIKVDGLPADFVDKYIERTDPATGRFVLPWFHRVFVERGARVRNFYVRGISLSAPSWSMLDTGQHLVIRGNADFNRAYPRVYDYLNFFPFYVGFARSRRADMPGAEVLDQCGIPLLVDRYPYTARDEGMQLYQRGVRWETLGASLKSRIARPVHEIIDEWQTGFDFGGSIMQQQERELIAKLADPNVLYLDYYTGEFDHTAHLTNDESVQLNELRSIDATLGRIWTAIGASPLADRTVLALVSDHGMNSTPGEYSEGYDLVSFFNSSAGGRHNVITNRHPRDQYKLSGLNPFVSWVVTPSEVSTYLAGDKDYPTALLDLDGNERASIQLRNSDLNELQILFQQLRKGDADKAVRAATIELVMRIVDRNRADWTRQTSELRDELAALRAAIESETKIVSAEPKHWTLADRYSGRKLEADRRLAVLETWQRDERGYASYLHSLEQLLALEPPDLDRFHVRIEDLIPKGVMGEPNSLGQMQRYVAGAAAPPVLNPDGTLDESRSFERINYFAALTGIHVRNATEQAWGSAPVDFVAVRVAPRALANSLPIEDKPDSAIFLYRDPADEALLLGQHRDGALWLRYIPITGAAQDDSGALHFTSATWNPGLPLKIFEDPDLAVPGDRAAWLSQWHSEREWFNAVYRTRYSNAVIGLHEYFRAWQPDAVPDVFKVAPEQDWPLLERFAARLRASVQPDMLVVANYGWNFNVRSFNPGGNHGSFFRISTHSVLMFAGAGVPPGLVIDTPYGSLNFVPTLLALTGKSVAGYPAPPIAELAAPAKLSASK